MSPIRLALAAAGFVTACLPAWADTPLPVHVLSDNEVNALSGMPYLDTNNQTFKMAASATASGYNKPSQTLGVQRVTGGTAAVYRGAPNSVVPLAPPMPPVSALFEMQSTGDSAQTWATMTSGGRPYIKATGFGAFTAEATASWHTSLTIPAGAAGKEVVVRFVVPPISVAGATEQQGKAHWRARMRADLLVNGFPAWSADALRFTTNPEDAGNNPGEVIVLQQFGEELGFTTNDEDADNTNNTTMGNINGTAPKKIVHVTLGRFAQGTVVDLSMLMRGTATSVPTVSGGTDNRCKWDNALNRFFCSRATVTVDGASGEAPRIYLLP